jgi:anhydro-N-acetylmuramic acid kinase
MPEAPSAARLVVGCMTGTSLDAADAALVEIRGRGLDLAAHVLATSSRPLGDLANPLRRLAEQEATTAAEIADTTRRFALLHAELVRDAAGGRGPIDLIAVHGQTVFHRPPLSWQLFSAPILAHASDTPVVTDLRAADLAAGGRGAPITPLSDWLMFRGPEPTAVINLGGFCNVTLLPAANGDPSAVRGLDVCACNHLLDTVARRCLGLPFDRGGAAALSAEPDDEALDDLFGLLTAQGASGRSLGTGDEAMSWVGRHRVRVQGPALAATACEAIAQTLAPLLIDSPRALVAGGGAQNAALVRAISSACSARVQTTQAAGVPVDARESAAMAILGTLCADAVPITLSQVTGVITPPVSGVWAFPPSGRRPW